MTEFVEPDIIEQTPLVGPFPSAFGSTEDWPEVRNADTATAMVKSVSDDSEWEVVILLPHCSRVKEEEGQQVPNMPPWASCTETANSGLWSRDTLSIPNTVHEVRDEQFKG